MPEDPIVRRDFVRARRVHDGKGQASILSFRVSADEARAINRLTLFHMRDGYETSADLLRHAFRRHLDALREYKASEAGDSAQEVKLRMEIVADILDEEDNAAAWEGIVERRSRQIRRVLDRGDAAYARSLVIELVQQVAQIGNASWRKFCVNQIRERWGDLLKSSAGRGKESA
jgi:hypothetical protein